jgi:hypothetical protein
VRGRKHGIHRDEPTCDEEKSLHLNPLPFRKGEAEPSAADETRPAGYVGVPLMKAKQLRDCPQNEKADKNSRCDDDEQNREHRDNKNPV